MYGHNGRQLYRRVSRWSCIRNRECRHMISTRIIHYTDRYNVGALLVSVDTVWKVSLLAHCQRSQQVGRYTLRKCAGTVKMRDFFSICMKNLR